MARVRRAHHVLGVEHLLCEFWHSQSAVLLRATAGQWGKADHEEVETWEWNQVHCKLSEIRVQLARETQAASRSRHSSGHQVVQVTIRWGRQLKRAEADIVQSLVIDNHDFICVLDKLMD
jgi:hypothetical protein